MKLPESLALHREEIAARVSRTDPKLAALYRNCYPNTVETALRPQADGTLFVLTGDIPAMWQRDSTAEVTHYLPAASDPEVAALLKAVLKRQFANLLHDPYANSFNESPNSRHYTADIPTPGPWVWEQKYEVDSLCYPLRLLYLYVKKTGDTSLLDARFLEVLDTVLRVFHTEQRHRALSQYRFTRPNCPAQDTLHHDGMGEPVGYTGMVWSGFRPSDDACQYGYLLSANMFASVVLGYAQELLELGFHGAESGRANDCKALAAQIDGGIQAYGILEHPKWGPVYVCETDGLGHYNILDDANVPSLLSIPYIGYRSAGDPIYQNTRRMLLSTDNPYYYEGKYARGIGSPHTPPHYIWHIALSMQGLTATDPAEVREVLSMLAATDGGTGFMHEGFDADDPTQFTRSWFAWSNSLFAELVENAAERGIL